MTCHNQHCSYTPPHGCHECPPPGVCPDFTIRRHDTKPSFKVKIEDCDGPFNMEGLILEASMWARGRLKKGIQATDTFFAFADNIGFEQIMVGDIIVVDRPRLPEQMLVIGFDEDNHLVEVQRGYHGTTPQSWKKGTHVRIIKFMGATAQTEMVFQDVIQVDGTTKNELTDSFLVYEWGPIDTCLAGCYFLEFKLLKMIDIPAPITPSTCMLPPVYGLVGPPKPYNAYGPHPGGTRFGPAGPFVPDGESYSAGAYGIPGTDTPAVPPVPMSREERRDDEVLADEYKYNPEAFPGRHDSFDHQKVVIPPQTGGNSPVAPLYPEPLSIDAGANPQYYNPAGVEQFFMPHLLADVPSFTSPSLTPADFGCGVGAGVDWVRRFPVDGEGFLIHITDSPTAE